MGDISHNQNHDAYAPKQPSIIKFRNLYKIICIQYATPLYIFKCYEYFVHDCI